MILLDFQWADIFLRGSFDKTAISAEVFTFFVQKKLEIIFMYILLNHAPLCLTTRV